MTGAEIARHFLEHLGSIAVVWLVAVGGAVCAMTALRGRPAYWLGACGAVLIVSGFLLGTGILPTGLTTTALGCGIVLTIFGVAFDLLLAPAHPPRPSQDREATDPRFE